MLRHPPDTHRARVCYQQVAQLCGRLQRAARAQPHRRQLAVRHGASLAHLQNVSRANGGACVCARLLCMCGCRLLLPMLLKFRASGPCCCPAALLLLRRRLLPAPPVLLVRPAAMLLLLLPMLPLPVCGAA